MSNLSSQNEEEEEDRSYRGPKLKLFSRKNDRARLAHPLFHLTPSRLSSQDEESSMTVKATIPPPPLHYAAGRGYFEIVCLLCDHGADVEARNEIGWTPLHYAAMGGYTAIVKELIEVRNADINARDVSYWTPRWWARNNFNANVAAYLAAHGGIF